MKTRPLKNLSNCLRTLLIAAVFAPAVTFGSVDGGGSTGGGDLCEDRIQSIRSDIGSWITNGGYQSLKLPAGLTAQTYAQNMLTAVQNSKVVCVKPGDAGYPIQVNGTAKICRFDSSQNLIQCDYNVFMDKTRMSESDQYILVHHELAGLAHVENPLEDVSTYTISNQLSGFLVDTVVKKLAVKPAVSPPSTSSTPCNKPVPVIAEAFKILTDPAQGAPQIDQYLSANPISMSAKNELCQTLVQAAIVVKKLDVFKDLYHRAGSPNVNSDNYYYNTSLYKTALRYGDMPTIQFIHSQGGKLSKGTEVMWAASGNDVSVVRALVNQSGASMTDRDSDGLTALMYAAKSGNIDVIKYLISLGSDVNAQSLTNGLYGPIRLEGYTPLMYAARDNTDLAASVLLSSGADANIIEKDFDDTSLQLAVESKNLKTVKTLVNAGADINHENKYQRTPLYNATSSTRDWAVAESIAMFLLDSGADAGIADSGNWTVLMNLAYTTGVSPQLISRTLQAGAKKDVVSSQGHTAYSLAKEKGQPKTVLDLLKF